MPRALWDTDAGIDYDALADSILGPPQIHDRAVFTADLKERLRAADMQWRQGGMNASEQAFVLTMADVVRRMLDSEANAVMAHCHLVGWAHRKAALSAYWGARESVSMAAALFVLPNVLDVLGREDRAGRLIDAAEARRIGRRIGGSNGT